MALSYHTISDFVSDVSQPSQLTPTCHFIPVVCGLIKSEEVKIRFGFIANLPLEAISEQWMDSDQICTYSGDPIIAKEVSKSFALPMILGKGMTFLVAEDHQTLQQNLIVERLVTPLFDQFAPILCLG